MTPTRLRPTWLTCRFTSTCQKNRRARTGNGLRDRACSLPIARAGLKSMGSMVPPQCCRFCEAASCRNRPRCRIRSPFTKATYVHFAENDIRAGDHPFQPLQHMYTVEDQVAALKTAAFHSRRTASLPLTCSFPNLKDLYRKVALSDLSWSGGWLPYRQNHPPVCKARFVG